MYEKYTMHEIANKIKEKEVSIKEVLEDVYARIDEVEPKVEAFVSLTREYAYNRAEELQKKLDAGEDIGALGGVPVAIKDNMCMKDTNTTCSSKMLENFVSPYDATVVKKLEQAGAIIIGKTNMDEFAMGSSTATSAFKNTKNPWNLECVPGGSSGGSAAAVASNMGYASLGSDTGGSIRQPAAYCGLVGLKPTYGLVSRFGLVAFGSSLDQIGPFTKNVYDSALMMNVLAGHDEMDTTSVEYTVPDYTKSVGDDVKGLKVGVPTSFFKEGLPEESLQIFNNSVEVLKKLGCEIVEVNLDYAKYALPTYYIIATAEASSNLARYDGIKYGYRAKDFEDLQDIYAKSRTEGFGEEVKRRIMLGTYVLSSGYYDAYYKRAGQVRSLIVNDFKKAFETVDVIALPTTTGAAFKFGEKQSNPIEMYLEDIFTVPVNVAGVPAISIQGGLDKNNMPIGLQFIANNFEEEKLFKVASAYENATDFHKAQANI
ncbi:MAG: Asp-tRNA(Asn)/Glu-tRNA(Gln) amidotransferase subunit GatA [Clostridia bacterium]|nr:Asp-tRNA(Asn)/Glu-tRNA(Gln) amidotransferase subunit GatA [Clostridia bacterium]